MEQLSEQDVKDALQTELSLINPEYHFERFYEKLGGSVISESFKGMTGLERQEKIWDALEHVYGRKSRMDVGAVFAYTPVEWNADFDV